MLISEGIARTKWCPFVRVDGDNRLHNTMTGGYAESEKMYHCIATDCMAWRGFHISHYKGSLEGEPERHGYCGLAGRPEME